MGFRMGRLAKLTFLPICPNVCPTTCVVAPVDWDFRLYSKYECSFKKGFLLMAELLYLSIIWRGIYCLVQDFFHQSSTNFTRSTEIKLSLMSHCIFPATLKAKSDGRTVRHARSSSIESQYFACRSRRIRPPFSVPNQFEFVWEKTEGSNIQIFEKTWNRRLRWRVIGSSLDKPHPPDWTP